MGSYYPPELVEPMRQEVLALGFEDLRTPEAVDDFFRRSRGGTALLFINSVCGCSAGSARPALAVALERARVKPSLLGTVFAGVDIEATARAREYLQPYPPSSPSMALLSGGELVRFIPRFEIEGRDYRELAEEWIRMFEEYFSGEGS